MCWKNLLFLHWRVDPAELRSLVPDTLEIDTFDGSAWIALVPFTMNDVLPAYLPRGRIISNIRAFSAFHECNVRTYVTPVRHAVQHESDQEPGVWFFSLDAASRWAVWAARKTFHLNYHLSKIKMRVRDDRIDYQLKRLHEPRAASRCSWTVGKSLAQSQPGDLEHFLTERYCLYSVDSQRKLFRSRVWHHPWPLQAATLLELDDSLIAAAGVRDEILSQPPLAHYAHELRVYAWRLRAMK
jgi:uncharacterized protein YqjF (DUF2071 family)